MFKLSCCAPLLSIINKMFGSCFTALPGAPSLAHQGHVVEQEREGEKGCPCLLPRTKKAPGCGSVPPWTSQPGIPVEVMACWSPRHGVNGGCFSTQLPWRVLLIDGSTTPAPPCGGHLCGSSTPGALSRHLMKGQAAGNSRGLRSGPVRRSFHPPLHLFTSLFLSRFVEGFSHNVSNFMVEFPEMIEKRCQNPRKYQPHFGIVGFTSKGGLSFFFFFLIFYLPLSWKSIDRSHKDTTGLFSFCASEQHHLVKTSPHSSWGSLVPHTHSQQWLPQL